MPGHVLDAQQPHELIWKFLHLTAIGIFLQLQIQKNGPFLPIDAAAVKPNTPSGLLT
jgi:hypothetical protein